MDQYIYNPPPPPPPPAPGSGVGSARKTNSRGNQTNSINSYHNRADSRQHPYKKPNIGAATSFGAASGSAMGGASGGGSVKMDGDLSSISPEIREAAKDIENWIAERRKKWPSAQRIVEKEKEDQQRQEREKKRHEFRLEHEGASSTAITASSTSSSSTKPLCRYFLKGKCKAGTKCQYSHDKTNPSTSTPKYKRFEAPDRSSLFKKLVQTDLDRENSRILDFLVYLGETGVL
ncbi:hypothetical protein AWJ20_4927 [Sugiyamaella lignohabitans]|uniref:C3H1-type domain-containing protein n=1 Tax=Sugiyamaella lignohabitans TaxID=796027 RepID=A0A167EEI7_9ASCO|nr:uncharacterized protein AWJ20_4927 [Sugiyamaella lignohabitans]ANB13974.1 hypothetical protein AWJ20_4927 [Sugiyamaella lignohabitans]